MEFIYLHFQEPSLSSASQSHEDLPPLLHYDVSHRHEALGEPYDEPCDNGDDNDESIQRVTLIAGYGHRDRHRHHYNEPGPSGWRISPIPWRMMLPDEQNYSEPGTSHSSSHQRACSSQDFPKADQFNKRQYEAISDHEQDTDASYKRFKSSPPPLDDIDRKISLAGKTTNITN